MKAKEYLQKLQKLDIVINQKIQELDSLKKMDGLKGIEYTREKVKCSQANCASFETILIKIIDMENEINSEIDRFIDTKHDIINQIQSLDNAKFIEVLYKRYVEYKRLEVVACEMNYTFQYVVLLHGQALKEFEQKFL